MGKAKKHRKWERIVISLDPKAKQELDYLFKKRKNYSRAAIIRDAIHQSWYDEWVDSTLMPKSGNKPVTPYDSMND